MPETATGPRRAPLGRTLALLALAAVYYAVPNARPDFTRFNCHDSESYLALSYSLTHGMGYTRSLTPGDYVAHEMWPPGLPLLLAPATAGAEMPLEWARAKRTMATLGLAGLIPVWFWVRRLADAPTADVATLVLGLNPFYWHFSHQAMAELPLFLWLVFGLWLIDRTWSRPDVPLGRATWVGLLCGLGLLIKGHVAGLALAPLAYLGTTRAERAGRPRVASWLIFCVALVLPFSAWLARNQTVEAPGPDGFSQLQQLRMADPMDPTSEVRGAHRSVASMISNLRSYAIYHLPSQIVPGLWPPQVFAWRGSGWPALALTLLLLGTAYRSRPGVRAALLVAAFLAALNLVYGYGGSPRFWVPVSLLILVLVTIRFVGVGGRLAAGQRRLLALAGGLALLVNFGAYIAAHERAPYNARGPWAELASLFETVRESPLEASGVLTPNPHAFQLATGLAAPMRVAESTYDHMVARLDGVGPQPPAGSTLILDVAPWGLFKLPEPTSGAELTGGPPRYPMEW